MGLLNNMKKVGGTLAGSAAFGIPGAVAGGLYDRNRSRQRANNAEGDLQRQEMAELERFGMVPGMAPQYQETAMGSNLPELQRRIGAIDYNTQGLDALRQEGLRQGPSAWAGLAKQRLGMDQREEGENLTREAAGSLASGYSSLAAKGGLSGGARERLASSNRSSAFGAKQALSREGMRGRLGVDLQDETNRQNVLRALPGLESQNVQTQLSKDVNPWMQMAGQERDDTFRRDESRNAFNLGRFGEQMSAYGSLKTAQAQRKAAPGKFLGVF